MNGPARRRHRARRGRGRSGPGPASSSAVSPLARRAIRKPAVWASPASPDMIGSRAVGGAVAAEVLARQQAVDGVGDHRGGHRGSRLEPRGQRRGSWTSSALPEPVRIDSGWNCTPSTGQVAVADAHHDVVVAPGGAARGRARGPGRPPASGSAWRPSGSRGPANTVRPSWWIWLVLPCTGSRPRTTRAPKAWPIGLVAEADAEDRHRAGQLADGVHRDAGLVGGLRARRDHQVGRPQRRTPGHVDRRRGGAPRTSAPSSPRYWTRL